MDAHVTKEKSQIMEPRDTGATTPLFQIVWIVITSVVFIYYIYVPAPKSEKKAEMPELLAITPARLKEFGGSPSKVKVGLFVRDFPEFDILKNEFVFSGILTLEFDPAVVSLETVGQFSFQKGEILKISPPYTQIKDGNLVARYNVRVKFKTDLNHAFFPLTDYSIHIVFDNYFVTPGEVIFEAPITQFVTASGMYLSGWSELDRKTATGYFEDILDSTKKEQNLYHPRVIFTIDYMRFGLRQLVSILLPLILIFFISIFSLSMDPREYYKSILTLSASTITALLAYKFVIENLSPKVGYFMLSDMLFFLFLTMTFVIFFFNTLTLTLSSRTKKWITVIVHLIVIGSCIYLFRFWMR